MNKLIKYFIDKPLFVNLLTFFVLITGLISLNQIKKEGYPAVDRKMLSVTTTYPGASPEDVELNVTIPLEKAIKSVDGIEKFTSQSYENYSKIWIHLDRDFKNSEKIKTDIRRAVDNVPDLPEEVKNKPDI